jgi:hypothetical protein
VRIILHIGTPKTGSTTLQTFLFNHRALLQKNGIIYPYTGLYTQGSSGPRHRKLTNKWHADYDRWQRLFEEIETQKANTCIISAEGFFKYPERADELRERFAQHDVSIVVYLRRQDRFLASVCAHRKRLGRRVRPHEIWRNERRWFTYNESVTKWERAFDRVIVRAYPEGGDVVADFIRTLELPEELGRTAAAFGRLNVSHGKAAIDSNLAQEILYTLKDGNLAISARYPGFADWFIEKF